MNLDLHSVSAVILIDSDGNRLLAKYYTQDSVTKKHFQSLKEQKSFEQAIWEKTRKQSGTLLTLTARAALLMLPAP